MNVRNYIASGILEEYCLGLLSSNEQEAMLEVCRFHPEVKDELRAIEDVMEKMAADKAVTPRLGIKEKILNILSFPEPDILFDLNNLPVTNAYSNHNSWLNSLTHLIPEEPTEEFSCQILRQDNQLWQMLITTKNNVPDEVHDNMKESFFILKGECKCTVGKEVFMLSPGGFLEIPLNQHHDVIMLTPYVTAILQYEYI